MVNLMKLPSCLPGRAVASPTSTTAIAAFACWSQGNTGLLSQCRVEGLFTMLLTCPWITIPSSTPAWISFCLKIASAKRISPLSLNSPSLGISEYGQKEAWFLAKTLQKWLLSKFPIESLFLFQTLWVRPPLSYFSVYCLQAPNRLSH